MSEIRRPSPLEIATIELGAATKIVRGLKVMHQRIDRDNHGGEAAQAEMNLLEKVIEWIEDEAWRK